MTAPTLNVPDDVAMVAFADCASFGVKGCPRTVPVNETEPLLEPPPPQAAANVAVAAAKIRLKAMEHSSVAPVLAKILHPNIIQIFEIVGTDDETEQDPYIVMEHFDGKPLDQALKSGALPQAQVVSVLRQTADGLRKAHLAGVIHRDVKPSNLMMNAAGEVKILDFGIAKPLDAKKDLTGQTV